jgi:hypothetical protein
MSPVSIASVALASQFLLFCFALLMTARNRARWRRILGHLDRRGEAHGAAVISAFIGGISPHAAMTVALASFRGLPFGELTEEDLRHAREHDGRADGDTLAAHSTPIEFGGCDGFVSHAWADDHSARWRALSRWAKDFRLARSRDPMCWLDKACIDQSNIDESLKCLPVFLAGAQRMVILAGPSYPRRLWCIIEAFTFLRVGADPSRIKVIPLGLMSSRASGDATSATDRVRDAFAAFDIRDAQCYAADRDRLLGAIESAFDNLDEFNKVCSTTLVAAADRDRMLANVGLAWTSNDEASPDFRTIEDGKKRWGKIRTATKIAFALQPMPEAPHTSNLPKDELEAREAAAKATPPTSLRQSPSRKLSAALSKSQRSLRKDSV